MYAVYALYAVSEGRRRYSYINTNGIPEASYNCVSLPQIPSGMLCRITPNAIARPDRPSASVAKKAASPSGKLCSATAKNTWTPIRYICLDSSLVALIAVPPLAAISVSVAVAVSFPELFPAGGPTPAALPAGLLLRAAAPPALALSASVLSVPPTVRTERSTDEPVFSPPRPCSVPALAA